MEADFRTRFLEGALGVSPDVGLVQTRTVRDVLPLAGREIVEHVHFVTTGEQCIDDVRADEARASGHDHPHAPYRTAAVFITFEGVDGSGKTTQAELLAETLRAEGREVVATREPGGTALGEEIRQLLLEGIEMSSWAEAALFAAARAELANSVIAPALEAGADVVCDRYIDSSLAYQGIARNLGVEQVLELNLRATQDLLPDRTFLIVVDPRVARERSTKTDRIEREGSDFHRTVDRAYRALASMFPQRIITVDGNRPPEEIAEEIRGRLRELS
jgi:dTMP kinase